MHSDHRTKARRVTRSGPGDASCKKTESNRNPFSVLLLGFPAKFFTLTGGADNIVRKNMRISIRYSRLFLYFCMLVWILSGCVGTETSPFVSPSADRTITPVLPEPPELGNFFQGYSGAFVLYDLENNHYIRFAPERDSEQLIPASTFKILNSLIGLETGVIRDENYVLDWDGRQYPIASWNQNHTLKSAIQNSVVWYYQELARRVGKPKMKYYVDLADYGNQDISGEIDRFWLDGGLRISAEEQVTFLKRLYLENLPFSQRSIKIVKAIIVLEETPNYRLSGKTGTAVGSTNVGWFVGYLEENANVYFFATNIKAANSDVDGPRAKEICLEILKSIGLLSP